MAGALALGGTFLLAAAFHAVTAHVAAAWVLETRPIRAALLVGPVPAVVVTAGQVATLSLPVVAVVAVALDALAIAIAYELSARRTALMTGAHLVVSVALGIALANLAGLLA